MSEELTIFSAARLVELMRARSVSPVEVLEAHLRRAERLNPRLNAIVTFAPDARERAREAEREIMRGAKGRPLLGLPVTVKDTLDTRDLRTTRGSPIFAEHVPVRDAPAVALLRAAGAIILGKTNTSELALDYTSDNPVFGRTLNPHDAARTPGGSSGGCAAAVAACLAPASLGSDMVGSIRIPAHFCGVAGLKPTAGLVNSTGHFPPTEGVNSLSATVGPVARTVEDLSLIFDALNASDALKSFDSLKTFDALSSTRPGALENTAATLWGETGTRRVAYYTDDGATPVCEDVRRAVVAAARALRDASGAACELAEELPPGVGRGAELWRKLFAGPVREVVRETYRGREGEAGPAARAMLGRGPDSATGRELNSTGARELSSETEREQDSTDAGELSSIDAREQSPTNVRELSSRTERVQSSAGAGGGRGAAVDGGELLAARRERDGLLAGLLRWMEVTPIFVAPVGAVAAFEHGARRVEADGHSSSVFRAFAHSQAFSALGLPVVTVPAWRTAGGLPIGVQIVGRPREERRVLAAARVVERALGGWQPPPDFASNLAS